MAETFDQVFVLLKSWLVGFVPEAWQGWASALLTVLPLFVVFPLIFAITTVLERKGIGRIQNRLGPNRVGPYGFLQFVADGVKALTKEDVVPRAADRVVHFLAPLVILLPAFLALGVVPVGRNMVALDLETGLLFFFAVGAGAELAVFMAGWSSRNKYSLLGAMRAIAQMVSYELPLVLATVTVVMMVGSLSTVQIVEAQAGYRAGFPDWHVLTPWGLAGFLLFVVAATAESNRSPFDLPEGESEIVAGYFLEYSGFKFAMFYIGEYLGMVAVSALGITLFLGGWAAPFAWLTWIPSWLWFFGKLAGMLAFFIWMRGTLPRLRIDQLMQFAWKFLLPLSLINIAVAGIWRFQSPGVGRWVLASAVLIGAYVGLGRGLWGRRGRRIYRYAE